MIYSTTLFPRSTVRIEQVTMAWGIDVLKYAVETKVGVGCPSHFVLESIPFSTFYVLDSDYPNYLPGKYGLIMQIKKITQTTVGAD